MKDNYAKSYVYRSMNLFALVLACLLTTLPGCGDPSPAGLSQSQSREALPPRPKPSEDVEQPAPAPIRLSCEERQGRSYVAPSEVPTWDGGMRIMVMQKCLPCHNRNFAAGSLLLTTYEEHMFAAESSAKRIKAGLLKPLAAHESYPIQLWLLNGLPRSKKDIEKWKKGRCVTLP